MTEACHPNDVASRFWAKVDQSAGNDGCWPWLASRFPSGYGVFGPRHGEAKRAHRVAYELARGPIPPGALVLHSCDNPSCVNPSHLRIGDHADNMRDKVERGRQKRMRGAMCGTSKLNDANVRLVRAFFADGIDAFSLRIRFGLSRKGIEKIIKRQTWGHLE